MLIARKFNENDHALSFGVALRRAAAWSRAAIRAALHARRIRAAEMHLETLDARMLADIGICRADIAHVVREGRLRVDVSGTLGLPASHRMTVDRAMERSA